MRSLLMALMLGLFLVGACSPGVETVEVSDPAPVKQRANESHKELKREEVKDRTR